MGWFIWGAEMETFMRSIRPPAGCVGNSKPAMFCTPRPRSKMAFCFLEVGIVISMPWTLRQEKREWRFHGGEDSLMHNQVGFQSSPAVVNGTVYTGCRDSNLYALDTATGKEKWRLMT